MSTHAVYSVRKQYILSLMASLAVSGLAFATATQAADIEPAQVKVEFDDLDLTTTEGADTLYRRLRMASKQVCSVFEGRETARIAKRRSCYEEALASAVTRVNSDTVTALHRRQGSRQSAS